MDGKGVRTVAGTALDLLTTDVSGRTQWRVLRLRLPDGRHGIGEASDSGDLSGAVDALENLLPHLEDLPDATSCSRDVVRRWADAGLPLIPDSRFARAVLGGLEQAVCDIAAQDAGQPVWRWLDDGRESRPDVPTYANINRTPGGRRPEDLARNARVAVDSGFGIVKCAPWDEPDGAKPQVEAGMARLRAIRAAIGTEVELLVDCHLRLGLDEITTALPELHDLAIGWLEDAVESTDLDGLSALRAATDLPLAGGEFSHDPDELVPALESGLLDVVLVDVKHAGGITRAHALAEVVGHFAGVTVSPHNPTGPVGTVASAHLFLASSSAGLLELAVGETAARPGSIRPPESVSEGRLSVPEAPGLGVDIAHDSADDRLAWSRVWSTDSEEVA